MRLLPKYCESTRKSFCLGKPSTPFAELFAFETDPVYLANLKVYYLDHIVASSAERGETIIKLLSDEELKPKKRQRKTAPKVCPHCGKSLKIAA